MAGLRPPPNGSTRPEAGSQGVQSETAKRTLARLTLGFLNV